MVVCLLTGYWLVYSSVPKDCLFYMGGLVCIWVVFAVLVVGFGFGGCVLWLLFWRVEGCWLAV